MIQCRTWKNTWDLRASAAAVGCLLASKVRVHLVAPADSEGVPEDIHVHGYVVPRATTRLDVYVLGAQIPALIAFVRHELTERRREAAPP